MLSVLGNVVVQNNLRIASKMRRESTVWVAVVVENAQNQRRIGSVAGGNGVERAMESDAGESQQSNGVVLAMMLTQKRVQIDGRKKPKRGRKRSKVGLLAKFVCCEKEEKLVIVVGRREKEKREGRIKIMW